MNYIISIMPSLLSGAKMTLILFLWTLIISIPLGIIVSLGLISHFKILYLDYAWYTIVTTINLYFLWATIIGIIFQRYNAALFAFILNYTAYFAEIFRSGFQSVPIGQYESAYVLQLTKWQTLRHIIIPQVSKMLYRQSATK
ncbi:ABC transporter permease subunit [Lactobacillus apis]|uniref:ABC transporter permease subunit n=1 Tax=Lactobacillus apis TaxID=303541 RepID=UPI0024330473|nr:ABC transporter permease subunit [Lactobacillus apis]